MTQVNDFLRYQYALAAHGGPGGAPVFYRAQNAWVDANGVRHPGRCEPELSGFTDCSGLQTCAMRTGVHLPTPAFCMTSGEMFNWCEQAGTLVPVESVRFKPGYWLFVGYRGSIHIAVTTGDGRQFAAHSPRIGLGFGNFDWDNWSAAGAPPGLDMTGTHTPPPIPNVKKVNDMQMIVQIKGDAAHYVTDGITARHISQAQEDIMVITGLAFRGNDNLPIQVDRDFVNDQHVDGRVYPGATVPGDGKR